MLIDDLSAFFQRYYPRCDKPLVVGVSGGPDSLALLHALAVGGVYPRELVHVGHLDHGLRPEGAEEAQLVARQCARWGVACYREREDVAMLAGREGRSLEEAGRVARYHFLAGLARQVEAPAVAVGHNADDQAETVLMHFLRGSGSAGLRGMRPDGTVPGARQLTLLRPLLYTGRAEIEAYCAAHELEPVTDLSNEDRTFFRNRLRHELLPLLEEYNPRIRERLQHSAEVIAADYALLAEMRAQAWDRIVRGEGTGWVRVDLAGWRALPLSLRRSTLRHAVWQLRGALRDVTFEPVEQARRVAERGRVGDQAFLPGELLLTIEYEGWRLETPSARLPVSLPQLPEAGALPLIVPGRTVLAHGWVIDATQETEISLATIRANIDPWQAYLAVAVPDTLSVRGRHLGERFQPLGMEGRSAQVKEVMINEKLPARLRTRWPLVVDDQHLLWLVGYRIDRRARVTPSTETVLHLHCHHLGNQR